jgi:drug/metabolite transporter (DMT)-like permease
VAHHTRVAASLAGQASGGPDITAQYRQPDQYRDYRGPVTWGLAGAFAAAFAYGAATILQALGAREGGSADELDARLVRQLLRSTVYLVGLCLDAIGFGLSFAALHSLPLFVVQAIVASSLAVTAVLAVLVMGLRPSVVEWMALAAVTIGLTLLALSARREAPTQISTFDRALLVISVAVVGVLAFGYARRRHEPARSDVWALGALAGLMYGAAGIGARILRTPSTPWRVFLDPAFYAMALAGLLGLLLYAMALQRGSVTVATSAVVVAETLMPALVGLTLLGDRPADGRTGLAIAGFILTVGGAVALARYGQAPPRTERYPELAVGTLPAP